MSPPSRGRVLAPLAGLVYTTDGRLSAFNLKLLDDDMHYFPDYTFQVKFIVLNITI